MQPATSYTASHMNTSLERTAKAVRLFFLTVKTPRRVSPPKWRNRVKSFFPAACTSDKNTLHTASVELSAKGGQPRHSAKRVPLGNVAEPFFRHVHWISRLPKAMHLPLFRSKSITLLPPTRSFTCSPIWNRVLPNTTPVSRKPSTRIFTVDSIPVGMAP